MASPPNCKNRYPSLRLGGSADVLYDLCAAILHDGSVTTGHYTACVLRNGQWCHINDLRWNVVSADFVMQKRNAYVLVYTQRLGTLGTRPLARPLAVCAGQLCSSSGNAESLGAGRAVRGTPELHGEEIRNRPVVEDAADALAEQEKKTQKENDERLNPTGNAAGAGTEVEVQPQSTRPRKTRDKNEQNETDNRAEEEKRHSDEEKEGSWMNE